ncbi:MAG: nucleotidyltransferase family protein [Treponema sp.]|jgi:molybdenum cofactor cytidylyltransferase|nr:nucleotidyltransferase family protein [Treponema sp.]
MDPVAAVLMASGFSRRFGERNKLLEPFRAKPLGRYTLELAAGLAPSFAGGIFFVVSGDETGALAEGLPGIRVIRNGAPEKGQRESIRAGVEAAGEAAAYYMFFPCDQPFLDAASAGLVLEARRQGAIVLPRCRNERGSPVLFCRTFRDELLNLAPGEHGRDILARHPDRLIMVDIPCPPGAPSPLTDIDDPESFSQY